eukprot:COSAG05_NODE_149_length_16213_cov_66.750279_6_plen_59_part_00
MRCEPATCTQGSIIGSTGANDVALPQAEQDVGPVRAALEILVDIYILQPRRPSFSVGS